MKYLLFFLYTSAFVFSQEIRKDIKGSVQFTFGEGLYENIRITNLNTQVYVFTNILGQFTISAQKGDVLQAESLDVYTETAIISEQNYKQQNLLFLVESKVYELNDLQVYSFTGNLEYDSKRIKYKNELDEILENMGIPQGKPRDELAHLTKPVVPVIPLSADLDALFQIISGNRKRGKDLYFYQEREKTIFEVRDYYGENYFVESLQIPKLEIYGFLITAYENTNLKNHVKSNNYYLILPLLQAESINYKLRLQERVNQSATISN